MKDKICPIHKCKTKVDTVTKERYCEQCEFAYRKAMTNSAKFHLKYRQLLLTIN